MSRKRGDRKDGVWLKELDGFHYIMPYLMPSRCDAEVYIEKQLDVTQLMKFLEEKNAPGAPHKTTIFHVFVTAVAKVCCSTGSWQEKDCTSGIKRPWHSW